MSNIKEELISILMLKNENIDDFKTATLSCVTNLLDYEDDLEKADKYTNFVKQRQKALDEITKLNVQISSNEEMKMLYESDDSDIVALRNIFKKFYDEIAKLQPQMDELGRDVLTQMRGEFKKIKQKQNFNKVYFNSPYTSGTKFDAKQ